VFSPRPLNLVAPAGFEPAYQDAFIFDIEQSASLNEGMVFLSVKKATEVRGRDFLTAEYDPNVSLL
jgi:hypothetical protein